MKLTPEMALEYHLGGKIGLKLTKRLDDSQTLSLAYTPGVAEVCKAIVQDRNRLYSHTAKSNLVAVVSDGTAVLGLGDIGAAAGIPVMEGKCALFRTFGEVDAWPVTFENARVNGNSGPTDVDKVVEFTAAIANMYGGINLEDIAAPACFDVEDRLQEMLDIPVFHDDQWGTAVITLAGVINYCVITGKAMDELKVAVNGAGAAGVRIAQMIMAAGVKDLLLIDTKGVCHSGRDDLNPFKRTYAVDTAARTHRDALAGADLAIMVSNRFNRDGSRSCEPSWLKEMNHYPGIFSMANPDPEIYPDEAREVFGDKPYIMSTGRSDFPNQVNNVLGFPFIFRGALDVRAKRISMNMKIAAAEGLARLARESVPDDVKRAYGGQELEFGPGYIIPKPFDRRLLTFEALAVAQAAVKDGDARVSDISNYPQYLAALAFTPKIEFAARAEISKAVRFEDNWILIDEKKRNGGCAYLCDAGVETGGAAPDSLAGKRVELAINDGKVKKIDIL